MPKWNDEQQRAIQHRNGPAMILAGPGSGKTLVIIQRLKYMVEACHIEPSQILVITFTKAAAAEMLERFQALMGRQMPIVFGTFHAVFFHILQHTYGYTSHNIITEYQKQNILKQVLSDLGVFLEDAQEYKELLSYISVRKRAYNDKALVRCALLSEQEKELLYQGYLEKCKRSKKVDFDDMIFQCLELLKSSPSVLAYWQNRFSYILIDEFQDIDICQYELIQMLAEKSRNLFVVGDDDQAIYGFRGAKPEIMLCFPKVYTDTEVIPLRINYRSTPAIVQASQKLIAHNRNRYEKESLSEKGKWDEALKYRKSKNGDVVVHSFQNIEEEAANIIQYCRDYVAMDVLHTYEDIGIIYRTNAAAGFLIEKFSAAGLPFQIKEEMKGIYDTDIATDILTYMEAAKDYQEQGWIKRSSLFFIMNKPVRYFSRKWFPQEEIYLFKAGGMQEKKAPPMKEYLKASWKKFCTDIIYIGKQPPYACIQYIRKAMGYEAYCISRGEERGIDREEIVFMLNQLQEAAKEYMSLDEMLRHVEEEKIILAKKRKEKKQERKGIQITTYHGSKGLEYKRVILPDVNEGYVPHKKAETLQEVEEERRMFYVAMTRAREKLLLFYVENRATDTSKKRERSRFLDELQDVF